MTTEAPIPPTTQPPAAPPPHPVTPSLPTARPFPWIPYTLLALLSAAVIATGLYLRYWLRPAPPDPGTVTEIRLAPKAGLDLRQIEDVLGAPSYYLEIRTDPGSVRTPTIKSTRIGNGLTFKLPVPIRLLDIKEVKVWDENTMRKDTQVDRLDNTAGTPSRTTSGERFTFTLTGYEPTPPADLRIGLYLAIAGGAVFLLTLLAFVRAQVI